MIKIITEPTIYLVGRPELSIAGISDFLDENGITDWKTDADFGEYLIELAGRLCYMSFKTPRPGGNKAYIGHLLEVGHGSVLEHAVWNFIITGVSRSFTHELVRHRAGFAYSQLSQRYVDESDVAFVVPPIMIPIIAMADNVKANEQHNIIAIQEGRYGSTIPIYRDDHEGKIAYRWHRWVAHMEVCLESYKDQVWALENHHPAILATADKTTRRKMAREAARSVLPNATETKIFVTANARALRHFVEMRANPAADAEIRRVAVAILRIMQAEAPHIFGDYTVEPCPLGGESATTPHRKV